MHFLTWIENAGRIKRAALAFALGAAASMGMAPYNMWPLLMLCLSGLYLLLARTNSPRGAFCYGWLFTFGYFFTGLFWVKNALLVDGNPFSWIWPLAVAGLPSLLAFFGAIGAYVGKKIFDLKTASGFFACVALLATAEWARGFVFTGYPWNLYGATWAGTLPMLQMLSFSNIYFLTWLTLIWFTLPGFLVLKQPARQGKIYLGLFAIITFVLCLGFGVVRLQTATPDSNADVHIHLVQANVKQSEKWDRSKMGEHFLKAIALSNSKDAGFTGKTLIVWPETEMNYLLVNDPIAMKYLTDMLKTYKGDAVLLTGLLRHPEKETYYNSLVMIDKDGKISNVYDKSHLVPFGEYIPFQKWIPLKPVVEFSGFVFGDGPKTFEALGVKYSPVICYEIIFSGKVAGPKAPDVIINVTNDAWYGISAGPYQHFTQALFRAIEEGIPVARAANTGFSGLIDPFGHIHNQSELYKEYEKTLALPTRSMVFRGHNKIKTIVFAGLVLLSISFGYFRAAKRGG